MKHVKKMLFRRITTLVLMISIVPSFAQSGAPDDLIDRFYNQNEAINAHDLLMLITEISNVYGESPSNSTFVHVEKLDKLLTIIERYIDATGSLPDDIEHLHRVLSRMLCRNFATGEGVDKDQKKALKYARNGLKYAQILSANELKYANPIFAQSYEYNVITDKFVPTFKTYIDIKKSEEEIIFFPYNDLFFVGRYKSNEFKFDMDLKDKDIYLVVFPDENTHIEKNNNAYVVKYTRPSDVPTIITIFGISCTLNSDSLAYFTDFETPVLLKGTCRGIVEGWIKIENCSVPEELYGNEENN